MQRQSFRTRDQSPNLRSCLHLPRQCAHLALRASLQDSARKHASESKAQRQWRSPMSSAPAADISSVLRCPPINLIYLHYHNAIRAELNRLSKSVNELEKSSPTKVTDRLSVLKTQYRFLEKVYKYHSSVEDEVNPSDFTRRGRSASSRA